MVRPTGIEPVRLAPEASALSPELRAPGAGDGNRTHVTSLEG